MVNLSLLAVAAPIVHTEVNATADQPVSADLSWGNYVGGVAIAAALAVMVIAGSAAAGLIKPRKSAKLSHSDAPKTAH